MPQVERLRRGKLSVHCVDHGAVHRNARILDLHKVTWESHDWLQ